MNNDKIKNNMEVYLFEDIVDIDIKILIIKT